MTHGSTPEVIEAIRSPTSVQQQIAALKKVKNDIVGHDLRKELVVKQGLLQPLVAIITSNAKAADNTSPEGDARLEAALILSVVARLGPAIVPPFLAAGAPKALVGLLQPEASSQLIIAALQALDELAASWSLRLHALDCQTHLPLGFIDEQTVKAFDSILRRPCTEPHGQLRQFRLTLNIITLCAEEEVSRELFTSHGLLDLLTSLLCAYGVESGQFNYRGREHPAATQFGLAPKEALVPPILDAIASIIEGSHFRCLRFILSQPVQDLFAYSTPPNSDEPIYRHSSSPQAALSALLPALDIPAIKTVSHNRVSKAFPVLGSLQSVDGRSTTSSPPRLQGWYADHAAAVGSWMIVLSRQFLGYDRLLALRLVASVSSAIEADANSQNSKGEDFRRSQHRERQLSILAVPLAVALISSASDSRTIETTSNKSDINLIKERSCNVLANLIHGSKALSAAAVEAGAIKHVSPILKKSFDSVPLSRPMWSARSTAAATQVDDRSVPEASRLGPQGLPREIVHAMRCRQSALEAFAALAKGEDVHRKAIIEAGVIGGIIDSLKPLANDFVARLATDRPVTVTPKDGSIVPVVLSACHAAQSMTAAVALLRTSLLDAGIALPLFNLLKHPNLDVKIAATDVCCNVVLDFSPMREDLVKAGVIKTLTEHVRQSDMRLRLSSMWALKHLVLSAPREIKVQCLEELGTGWLVGAIQGEQRELGVMGSGHGGGVSVGLSAPNAAGEHVDLLNPSSMEIDETAEPGGEDADVMEGGGQEEGQDEDDEDGEVLFDEQSSTHYQASQLRSTLPRPAPPVFNQKRYLSSIKEMEGNPALQARRSDIAVQEQALDFLRNLLNGEENPTMLDYILQQIGTTKLFALLTDKLSPLPASASARARSAATSARSIFQPTELILSTIHVMTHIANGAPKHKLQLIAQRALLTAWVPHFSHPDRRVRVISVWAVNSLTWIEDDGDRAAARQRAHELRLLGVEAAVRALAADPVVDVRERVKTALRQLDGL